ncbi:neutral/alkaline non-lysosomal ceramidase N-terminal domain-containing protein [Kineococcus arenarius]|uniref:neutral/alkaline non-lysosomal ceramidase N-terminal domain-containing protein n=1 Tax=Kineococcus sp. SYSU DK007 TaxID=3383128 RepID=UPI003D7D4838
MKRNTARRATAAAVLTAAVGFSPLVAAAVPAQQTAAARAATGAAAAQSDLRAGAARVDITPAANPEYPALGEYEHERLNVRAIVFENQGVRAALIGADLSGIDEAVWADAVQRIAAELQTPVENIVISSTHSHSAYPAGPSDPQAPRYGTEILADKALEAVRAARAELEPAQVGYASGSADLNVNRDALDPETGRWTQAANLDAPADKEVAVLTFTRPDGSPIATYANYAMHPVNGYLSGAVSGDFPAATSRHVEQAFGDDVVAVFTQGASGDVNPKWLRTGTNVIASRSGAPVTGYEEVREDVEAPVRNGEVPAGPADPAVLRQLFDYVQAAGIVLGEEVIRVMSHTEPLTVAPTIWSGQDTATCPGRTRLDDAREGVAGEYEDGPDVDLRLGVLGIGDVALTTANAEIYTRIGLRVKEDSPLTKTMFVTLANGRAASGYVPDDESFSHQTFQVLGSRLKPGCAEDAVVEGLADLVGEQALR